VSEPDDDGRSPPIEKQVYNKRMVDPGGITDLNGTVIAVGLLNKEPRHALDFLADDGCIDKTSLRPATSETFVRIAWNRMNENQMVILVNGYHRLWLIWRRLAPSMKKCLAEFEEEKKRLMEVEADTPEWTNRMKQLEDAMAVQSSELDNVRFWLVRVLNRGTAGNIYQTVSHIFF
jgi:hypothetical protein